MPLKKPSVNINHLPDDLFTYQNDDFYDFVNKCIGKKQADLLKFEDISSADIYLTCTNVLAILKLDSAALLPFKQCLCLKLDDNSFIALPGIKSSFAYLTELLIKKKVRHFQLYGGIRQNRLKYIRINLLIAYF